MCVLYIYSYVYLSLYMSTYLFYIDYDYSTSLQYDYYEFRIFTAVILISGEVGLLYMVEFGRSVCITGTLLF